MDAFLSGLSSGVVCLAYCAPVLVPCLLAGSGGGVVKAAGVTAGFLGGRLLGYLIFAVAAWLIGKTLLGNAGVRESVIGLAYMVLSVMLVAYAFTAGKSHSCEVTRARALVLKLSQTSGSGPFMPAAAGVATGLNFCPPFSARRGRLSGKGQPAAQSRLFLYVLSRYLTFFSAPLLLRSTSGLSRREDGGKALHGPGGRVLLFFRPYHVHRRDKIPMKTDVKKGRPGSPRRSALKSLPPYVAHDGLHLHPVGRCKLSPRSGPNSSLRHHLLFSQSLLLPHALYGEDRPMARSGLCCLRRGLCHLLHY